MVQPVVSIIIPCFNQAHFLTDTLNSVFSQTYSLWECVIINDGSTDHTEEIALNWCKKDNRFHYYKKTNEGLSSARNKGLAVAKGRYIQFLDSDDLLNNNKIEISINYFDQNPDCDVVITNFETCNEDKNIRSTPHWDLSSIDISFQSILFDWDKTFTIPIHCGLFKSSLFYNFQFNEHLKAKEDWLMWLHIYHQIYYSHFIDEAGAVYRNQSGGMSKDYLFMMKNTASVFQYIIHELIDEKYKKDFFNKVNDYWLDQLNSLTMEREKVLKSTTYKLSDFFLSPAKRLKDNLIPFFKK